MHLLLKNVLIMILIACSVNAILASSAFRTSEFAVEVEKKTITAIDQSSGMVNGEKHSPQYYHNAAQTSFERKNYVNALEQTLRGLKYFPNDQILSQDLQVLVQQIDSDIPVIKEFFLLRIWRSMYRFMSSRSWLICCIVFGLIILIILYLRWFQSALFQKYHGRSLLLLSIVFWIFSLICFYVRSAEVNAYNQAITSKAIALQSGPDYRSEERIALLAGEILEVIDHIEEWYKVALPNKQIGWLHQDDIILI